MKVQTGKHVVLCTSWLDNIILILDYNKLQSIDCKKTGLEPVVKKFQSFGLKLLI